MKIRSATFIAAIILGTIINVPLHADVTQFSGSSDALDAAQYINVVSEDVSPVARIYVKSADGTYIAAAIRKPPGDGPFPAIIMFHGAPGGRGMEQLVGWSRGDHGGPVWERFLQEGFVVVVADYRGGNMNMVNSPGNNGVVTAIDDGISVIDYVRQLSFVDNSLISVYGVSLGGNLALFLAAEAPDLHAVIVGAPFPVWFLGSRFPVDNSWPQIEDLQWDSALADSNIRPIQSPLYILVGTADPLLPLAIRLHDELNKQEKAVRMEIYQHGYHDFVLGPQGHDRADLPNGEILLQGALDALDRSVKFVKSPD